MPVVASKPVDIACLLLIAKGRRQGLRARCPGDRFRAAMAILRQEKERMRGKWSLDSVYEWPDDGDEVDDVAEREERPHPRPPLRDGAGVFNRTSRVCLYPGRSTTDALPATARPA